MPGWAVALIVLLFIIVIVGALLGLALKFKLLKHGFTKNVNVSLNNGKYLDASAFGGYMID
jgi:hypothetical protein